MGQHLSSWKSDARQAVTVKLTRTLAIIPITLGLAVHRARKAEEQSGEKVSMRKVFPFFILFFIGASIITTVATAAGIPAETFQPLKELSKFFIVMAMGAIGFNTNVVKFSKKRREANLNGNGLLDRDYSSYTYVAAFDAFVVK